MECMDIHCIKYSLQHNLEHMDIHDIKYSLECNLDILCLIDDYIQLVILKIL